MTKNIKILIIVLSLVIVGLISYIIGNAIINSFDDGKASNKSLNTKASNTIVNSAEPNTTKNNENEADNEVNQTIEKSTNTTDSKETKTDDSKKSDSSTKSAANKAIRHALKDEKWRKNNILPEYYSRNDDYSKALKANSEIYFAKIGSINGNPAYLVNVEESIAGSNYLKLVTYKDGKVVTSKTAVEGEYSCLKADLNNGIIELINNNGEEHVYTIENNEFREFARAQINVNDDALYYEVEGKNVSYGRFKGYVEKCVEIKTELTNKNIDTYVK